MSLSGPCSTPARRLDPRGPSARHATPASACAACGRVLLRHAWHAPRRDRARRGSCSRTGRQTDTRHGGMVAECGHGQGVVVIVTAPVEAPDPVGRLGLPSGRNELALAALRGSSAPPRGSVRPSRATRSPRGRTRGPPVSSGQLRFRNQRFDGLPVCEHVATSSRPSRSARTDDCTVLAVSRENARR